jgi:hypothetical protein
MDHLSKRRPLQPFALVSSYPTAGKDWNELLCAFGDVVAEFPFL